jgi:predicted nuclease of predicted toxin-antitoxin system
LDENIQIVVADQLRRRGIEEVTVRDLDALSDSDINHLQRATEMGYVLCTHDTDFVQLAVDGYQHVGIVIGIANKHTIGDWVRGSDLAHAVYNSDDMINRVEYL